MKKYIFLFFLFFRVACMLLLKQMKDILKVQKLLQILR